MSRVMIAGGIVISNGDGVTLNKPKQFFSKFVCSRKYAKRYKGICCMPVTGGRALRSITR
jgi:hypothetical protein